MAIIRLEDKYKSKYKIQLTPERHYISSSSGITGSVHVFPNRSHTQKDNIDERLNLAPGLFGDGKPIRPFGPNSLEQRRKEIYEGSFSKLIGGAFTDALQYTYTMKSGNWPNGDTGGTEKTGEDVNSLTITNPFSVNDEIQRVMPDTTVFKWTSNNNWLANEGTTPTIYSSIPTDDRDRSALRYDVALGLLLDGAHPFTEDHAWRQTGWTNEGNSSYTNANNDATRRAYQFTGRKVFTDELDIPYLDSPVSNKNDINSWPPEALLPDVAGSIITNFVLQGYSDLSMHPRNATKKEIIRKRANYDIFSSGSMFQKTMANRIYNLEPDDCGWWVDNKHSLCLGKWSDGTNTKNPALAYYNAIKCENLSSSEDLVNTNTIIKVADASKVKVGAVLKEHGTNAGSFSGATVTVTSVSYTRNEITVGGSNHSSAGPITFTVSNPPVYSIDWANDQTTIEFWVKPCKEQTDVGAILQLDNSYAIALIPDSSSLKDGVYSKFKIGIYAQSKSDRTNHANPSMNDVTAASSGTGGGIYVTTGVLTLDRWHHVAIRYGANFNNGLLNVYVDSVSVTNGNVDGQHNGGTRTTGIFDTQGSYTAGDTLFVGGWAPASGATDLWGAYANLQELKVSGNTANFNDGFSIDPGFQLKSELMELRIWDKCQTEFDLLANKNKMLTSTTNLKLYIPFLFDPRTDTPQWNRLAYGGDGNQKSKEKFYEEGSIEVITSSYMSQGGGLSYNKTQSCSNSAYIVGMPFINVHSHLREYVSSNYPCITGFYDLTDPEEETVYPSTADHEAPNDRTSGSISIKGTKLKYFQDNWELLKWLRAINSMIIPSDNVSLTVAGDLLSDGIHYYVDKTKIKLIGNWDPSSLDNVREIKHFHDDEVYAYQEAANFGLEEDHPDFNQVSTSFENYSTAALNSNGLFEDRDFISPVSTTIAVPQIYYGNRIHPETVELKFTLNEEGKQIIVKDMGGTLYRFDPYLQQKGSKVGHIDYGTGTMCVFSPLLTSIGIDDIDIKLKGEKNMHVMQLDLPCNAGVGNISQNPSYPTKLDTDPDSPTYNTVIPKNLNATANASETDGKLTYISSIYLHDENLNIIGKVSLAQPIQKREEDSYVFRVKVDF